MWSEDPDVRWVMKQNLTKKRLTAAGVHWVASWSARLADGTKTAPDAAIVTMKPAALTRRRFRQLCSR